MRQRVTKHLDLATDIFSHIQSEFSYLKSELAEPAHIEGDLKLSFPTQPGLVFDLYMTLDCDEFTLCVGPHWHMHYPAEDDEMVDTFFQDAVGLLEGRYRIVERLRNNSPRHAALQVPDEQGWKTTCTMGRLGLPFGRKSERIIQNQPSPSSS